MNFAGPGAELTIQSEAFANCTKINYIYNNRRISKNSSTAAFKNCNSNLKNAVKGNYVSEFKSRLGIK